MVVFICINLEVDDNRMMWCLQKATNMAEHRHILVYVVTYAAPEFPEFLISEYFRTGSSVEYVRILALFGTE